MLRNRFRTENNNVSHRRSLSDQDQNLTYHLALRNRKLKDVKGKLFEGKTRATSSFIISLRSRDVIVLNTFLILLHYPIRTKDLKIRL